MNVHRVPGRPRCTLSPGDFFGWFDAPRGAGDRCDVVLLDIDHSPRADPRVSATA